MDIVKQLQSQVTSDSAENPYLVAIETAKKAKFSGSELKYTDRDTILYNVSVGATRDQLDLVYEGHPGFHVLPTFGVIVPYTSEKPFDMSRLVPNFSYERLLHGEQYLEIRKWPIPTSAKMLSYPTLVDVNDKGGAAVIVTGATSVDARTGEDVFYNETTLFVRGSGGFGGPRNATVNRGKAAAVYTVPTQRPDFIAVEKTSKDQAALYRLNGDRNPLHINPSVAHSAGFSEGPILHGLCSFGISGKHILFRYGAFKNIKVRFSGVVFPGQTLQVEMWKQGQTILFQTRVKETGKLCISGGGAELLASGSKL
jgi:multifunctional beta-oxidation protein